jgi:hypothetical protein
MFYAADLCSFSQPYADMTEKECTTWIPNSMTASAVAIPPALRFSHHLAGQKVCLRAYQQVGLYFCT